MDDDPLEQIDIREHLENSTDPEDAEEMMDRHTE
jgi:hypothetical protein